MNTYLYRCYTLQLALLFSVVSRWASVPLSSLPNRMHDQADCLRVPRWYGGNRCRVSIVTLEFAHSCKLQQLYNNNDMSIPCAPVPLFIPARNTPPRCHWKIFTSIRSSPILGTLKGGEGKSHPQRNGCKYRVGYAELARTRKLYLSFDWSSDAVGWEISSSFYRMIIDALYSWKISNELLNPNCRIQNGSEL